MAFGNRSRKALSDLCCRQDATYERQDIDRYGRIVAVVPCNGINVNRVQVEAGMAWVYEKYNKDTELPRMQDDARRLKRGLWADPDPVSPWMWRRQKKSMPLLVES